MRHAFALLGGFAVVLLVYCRVSETPFLKDGMEANVPAQLATGVPAPTEPDGDAEAECAVLAHFGETMGHTFADGSRLEIAGIDGRTLSGVAWVRRDSDGRNLAILYAHRAIVVVAPASRQLTLELWTGIGLGPSGPADFHLDLPLSEFVPGL
jgi:hypothetical protein